MFCKSINNFDIGWPFFTLLGHNQKYPFLSAVLYDTNPESPISELRYLFGRKYRGRKRKAGDIPLVYPNQWVHSCMALSMRSSNLTHLQWMVSGILVANVTQETDGNHPQDLANSMILGKLSKATYFKRKQKNILSTKNGCQNFTKQLGVPGGNLLIPLKETGIFGQQIHILGPFWLRGGIFFWNFR